MVVLLRASKKTPRRPTNEKFHAILPISPPEVHQPTARLSVRKRNPYEHVPHLNAFGQHGDRSEFVRNH